MRLIFITFVSIFCLPAYCYECYIPGKCNAVAYKGYHVSSAEACIGHCSMSQKCIRSTFDPDQQLCSLYHSNNCTIDFKNCQKKMCVTSDKKCIYGKQKS